MYVYGFYNSYIPEFIAEFAATAEMSRLKGIGMNCGCEYTSFTRFSQIGEYSRYTHSLGTGLITWHFTHDMAASVAALMHDIASPVFAHTVDFMNGDYLKQESTENMTNSIICSSHEIMHLLKKYGLNVEQVCDYHIYPVADNDSPRLSADRLEYTLGNAYNYGLITTYEAENLYRDIIVGRNETGDPELIFRNRSCAELFAMNSLRCSRIYASDENRYSMQILSELLRFAIESGVISPEDLYTVEGKVIEKICNDSQTCALWKNYRKLSLLVPALDNPSSRTVPAKKRYIDPLSDGIGRVSSFSDEFKNALEKFMAEDFSVPVAAS